MHSQSSTTEQAIGKASQSLGHRTRVVNSERPGKRGMRMGSGMDPNFSGSSEQGGSGKRMGPELGLHGPEYYLALCGEF